MERLWAPWRGEYVENNSRTTDPQQCVFCALHDASVGPEHWVLHQSEHVLVVMNKFPYSNGHLLVMPKKHVSDFETLPEEVSHVLHARLGACVTLVKRVLRCHGVNVGLNLGAAAGAGVPGHMHYHVVPRWEGDSNFMPVVAETKVISQHMLATYQLLRNACAQWT